MLNAMLLTDGYKLDHRRQYPKGTEYVYSTWIPRSNQYLPEAKGTVVFGLQYMIKEYLVKQFNQDFFSQPKEQVVEEFRSFVSGYLNDPDFDVAHIEDLHDLGYLPIKIKALKEGSICPIGVPAFTVINTDPKFFWVTNFLETLISTVIWMPMTSATIAKIYKQQLENHALKTGFDKEAYLDFLCHDFSMRGMAGLDATIASGMGHLTSFNGSESLPAIAAVSKYYSFDGVAAGTIPATEHSVMSAGGFENELETYRRLITEVYPNGYCAIVSDTWDFWKVMTEYTVKLKEEILTRDGRVVFRPDSGNPVDIICGINYVEFDTKEDFDSLALQHDYFKVGDTFYKVNKKAINQLYYAYGHEQVTLADICSDTFEGLETEEFFHKVDMSDAEAKGAYELLWDIFGGTINDKGYKVLSPKVGIIYGDSITIERQAEIYRRLEEKGFAGTNLVLGIGSFTYQYKTRDNLGFAMKATWCQIEGESQEIFKMPKTDDGTKNSLKGLCAVFKNDYNGDYVVVDKVDKATEESGELTPIFENGVILKEYSFNEIKEELCKHSI